jgi:hypothetical protein
MTKLQVLNIFAHSGNFLRPDSMFFASFDRCRIAGLYTAIWDGSEVRACSTDIRSPDGADWPTD